MPGIHLRNRVQRDIGVKRLAPSGDDPYRASRFRKVARVVVDRALHSPHDGRCGVVEDRDTQESDSAAY